MNQTSSLDNMPDPVENEFSNSTSGGNAGCTSTPSFSDWDRGIPNSSPDVHSNVRMSNLEVGHGLSSSSSNYLVADARSENREFNSSNVLLHENCSSVYGGSHTIGRTATHHSSSNCTPGNVSLSGAHHNVSVSQVTRTVGSETELIPDFASSDNGGTSSYNSGDFVGNHDDSDSSLGTWGFSCKRRALEIGSGKSCAGGSSSSNPQAKNIEQNSGPYYNASSSFSLCSPSNVGVSEQANSRNGIGTRISGGDDVFPTSSVNGITDSSTRNIDATENFGSNESFSFGFPPAGASLGPSSVSTFDVPPRNFSLTSSSDLSHPLSLPMNSCSPANPSPSMASTSPQRNGSSSSSHTHTAVQDETSFGSNFISNRARLRYFSVNGATNLAQDTDNWISTSMSSSQNIPSSSGIVPSSSQQAFLTTLATNENPSNSSHLRLSDMVRLTHSPPAASEPETQLGVDSLLPPWIAASSEDPFPPLTWPTTSTEEPEMMSSRPHRRVNRHPYLRSTMTVEATGHNRGRWSALSSDLEGRLRVASEIRQLREAYNAIRRSEDDQNEDYTFGPFIDEDVELHDTHRDMRLDVDNMSYEELLALEDRIGNVNTGLSEATILGSMKQHKYESVCGGSSSSVVLEPCCICREEYIAADDIGTLGCGHEFHTDCIKQWLMIKNLCPICKMTGLET